MNFQNTIKDLRNKNNLTQEEMAQKLYVSRQAISNWENGKNLPDIEMLLTISKTFKVPLDDLINQKDNDITQKLINDTSINKRAKIYLYSLIIGTFLFTLGTICLIIKALSVEYIDNSGILHENFFLLPIGFFLIFIGLIVLIIFTFKVLKIKKK